jgi:F0F1-type ATP synthase membrane subunit b/b'
MEQNTPSINHLLDELEDILEDSPRSLVRRNAIQVNYDELSEIISEMRANLPNQIKQAEKIISNCNKTVGEANNQAKSIVEQAKTQAQQLTSEHEITQLAQEEAARIIDAAYEEAKNLRIGAKEYVKERMAETEVRLNDMLAAFSNKSIELQSFVSNELDQCYKIRQGLLDGTADSNQDYDDSSDEYDDENY